ncbi:putative membrane protein [Desulfoscipio gibsoniae DSM 7213]|uniref:Putative membrane protein n=1 Tax=Desulfoscipio gibsoniae DSM 7213 TaxID=767817 RepID=R4KTZ3_9FIRM|nr:putative membrane protein [Desulfoscipio gibsoniae DSM 7213]
MIIIRTLILYIAVLTVMRIMGKREIGQLQPFELVVALMIADLAAIPMQDTGIPLLSGIIPIIILMAAQVALSYISMKSLNARGIICGRPSVVVANGKLVEQELRYLRYNINDLLEQLRAKNYPNLADVEFAILETNGQLSVIPKSQKRALQPVDLQINTKYEGIPLTLIIDGQLNEQNLRKVNLTREWLVIELHKFGIDDFKRVLFASLDTAGQLFYQLKGKPDGGRV